MFYIHTFQSDGNYKLGSFSTLVVKDLKTLKCVKKLVNKVKWFDTRLGYEIEQVLSENPYAEGKIVYRSPRARSLFGAPT